MDEPVLMRKMANALFADARSAITDSFGAIAGATERQRVAHGGLWVGGAAELRASTLSFTPNALNKAVHVGGAQLNFMLPLKQVTAVRLRKAFITHIVDVDTPDGTYSLRCWGAQGFAEALDRAVRAART